MITIYITRHGETFWNIEKRLQGQGDSELTEKGLIGAELLADSLEKVDIDYIISSPLKRARKTSEIIRGNRNIPIIKMDELMEINIGTFSGYTVDEMYRKSSALVDRIINDPFNNSYPNGENLTEFYNRSVNAIKKIIKSYDGKTVLVVSHGGVLKCIEYYMRDKIVPANWENEIVDNLSLTKYEINGKVKKEIFFNKTSHLTYKAEVSI